MTTTNDAFSPLAEAVGGSGARTNRIIDSLRCQMFVIGALIMRDMRTRFGRRHIGYLAALGIPLCHIFGVMIAWSFFGRVVPLGSSPLLFYSVSLLPYIIFSYPFRQIATAVMSNKSMLYFPRVKIIDIMAARVVLESVAAFVVICFVVALITIAGEEIRPKDPFWTAVALFSAIYFGIGMGMLNGLIAAMYAPWVLCTALLNPFFWIGSGAMFMVETFPSPYREWLSYNPLMQSVELIREAYYTEYQSPVLSVPYLFGVSTAIIFFVLFAERFVRGRILQG